MSYTQHIATATCTIKHVLDVNDLCHQLYDYFTNHEDEIPEGLADCNSVEEFSEVVERYVALVDDKLIVTMDTEESNYDSEIFDAISSHYAHLMSSKFMKVTWVTYDSRDGVSADVNYYDSNNELINVEALI